MLVLSRKENQSIVINGNVTVTILRTRGDLIRVGIDAPKDVKVIRKELLDAEEETKPEGSGLPEAGATETLEARQPES